MRSGQQISSVATHLDRAVVCRFPQRLLVRGEFQRRVGVVDLPVRLFVILGIVHQVLVQGFAVDREALGARRRDRAHAGRGRGVHHVERRALDIAREPDHPVERQILRQRVVHLGHVLEAGALLAHQLLVHVHDDVVVLGVDRRDAAGLREDLQHLPDVAVLHHAALARRGDVGGEDLDAGMPGLHRLGDLRIDVGRQFCPAASCGRRSRRSTGPAIAAGDARSPAAPIMPPSTGAKSIVVVVPPNSAAWLTREAGSVSLASPSGHRHRPVAMDMRVDAAGDHDLPRGVDRAAGAERGEAARRADRDDLFALDADIGRVSAPFGRTARPPVITVSSIEISLCIRVRWSAARSRSGAARRRQSGRGFRRARCRGR